MTQADQAVQIIAGIKDKYKMTYRQAAFTYYFTGNGTDACRQAGYKGTSATLSVQASRLLKNDKIRQALQDRSAGQDTGILSPADLLKYWSSVIVDQDSSPADKAKAADSLAKAHAMYTDKQISLNYTKTDRLDQLSDQELDQLFRSIVDQLGLQVQPKQIEQIDQPE